ncbi:MAG TPA: hypothetical protein VG939_11965 [Caulobacteraceae bacterium]|nr:hypothetical protein [Caulobacteraceae bacterium]
MTVRDYMRAEYPAHASAEAATPEKAPRGRIDNILAATVFVAWLWCAWEIARAVL